MTGKIVVATDGSDTGSRAVELAAALSHKLEKDLTIVHVLLHGRVSRELTRLAENEHLVDAVRMPEPLASRGFGAIGRTAEDEIEEIRVIGVLGDEILAQARQMAEGKDACHVTTRVCAGDYADEILEVAEAEHAEMIVVGNRGLGRLREAVLGSVSQKILHHAPCAVVVAR